HAQRGRRMASPSTSAKSSDEEDREGVDDSISGPDVRTSALAAAGRQPHPSAHCPTGGLRMAPGRLRGQPISSRPSSKIPAPLQSRPNVARLEPSRSQQNLVGRSGSEKLPPRQRRLRARLPIHLHTSAERSLAVRLTASSAYPEALGCSSAPITFEMIL